MQLISDRDAWIGSVVGAVIFLGIAIGGYVLYRYRRREQEIFKRNWVIQKLDIKPMCTTTKKQNGSVGHGPHPRKRLRRMVTLCIYCQLHNGNRIIYVTIVTLANMGGLESRLNMRRQFKQMILPLLMRYLYTYFFALTL